MRRRCMENKLVSVYVCTRNNEKNIKKTINSILGQTYKKIELIIIDNCSTDKTVKIVSSIKDNRVKVYSVTDESNLSCLMNEGRNYCTGDYIAYCGAGDVWMPDKLQRQYDFLESHSDYGACVSHVEIVDEDEKTVKDRKKYEIVNLKSNFSSAKTYALLCCRSNNFCHSTFLARKDIADKVGLYDTSLVYLSDYDYFLRFLTVSPVWIMEDALSKIGLSNSAIDDEIGKDANKGEEYLSVIKKNIELCPDYFFVEAFKDKLCFDGEHTFDEIVIEKIFMPNKIVSPLCYNPLIVSQEFSRLLVDPQFVELLKNKFSSWIYEYITQMENMAGNLNQNLIISTNAVAEFNNSFFWRLTAPFRKVGQGLKNYSAKHKKLSFVLIVMKSFILGGPRAVKRKIVDLKHLTPANIKIPHTISFEQRTKEEQYKFNKDIKISILVPLYNTPENYLVEMIESVQNQTYSNWELCLVDGSTDDFSFVGKYCEDISKKDSRVKYKKLVENKGISENTNECLKLATGDYIALFDHDDYLHPSVLFEVMKRICDCDADYVYTDEATFLDDDFDNIITCHYKPDFSFDNLVANNYICHFSVFSASLLEKIELFRTAYDGSQDHDFILRITDAAKNVVHIPKILYFWRSHKNSVAMDINSKKYAIEAGKNAVHDFLVSKGLPCTVESSPAFPTIYKINYELKEHAKVSIIIPNKNHYKDLHNCVNSILNISTYDNYEIVIVDNQSTDNDVLEYYKILAKNRKIKIIYYDNPFNYSRINNFAVENCDGEYLLFLNNDTRVISRNWIEELLMYAQREDVGAVGAKLLFSNNTVQHGGIILGLGSDRVAGHSHYGCSRNNSGYMGKMFYAQDVSAVTAACMMIRRDLFNKVGGFDENLAVAYNDVDFCLKVRELNKLNVFNPFCTLYHFESISRGLDTDSKNTERFNKEKELFLSRWKETIDKGDPYYNPNLSLDESYLISPN